MSFDLRNMDMLNLLAGQHLLRALGVDSNGLMQQLQGHGHGQGLNHLCDMFQMADPNMGINMLANLLQSGAIPNSGVANSPNSSCCCCPGQYAQPQTIDLADGQDGNFFQRIMGRGRGMQAEGMLRRLASDPFTRQQVEMALGGTVDFGGNDGRIQVTPFPRGAQQGMDPAMMMVMGYMQNMLQGAGAGQAGTFPQAMLQGLAQALGLGGNQHQGAQGIRNNGGGSPFVDWLDRQKQQMNAHAAQNQPGGPHVNGSNHAAQGAFGMGPATDTASVLNDSSLTVEDKVVLMLMMIMKKFDKEIEKQAKYVEGLQEQQNGGGGGGKKGGGGGGGSSPSIDIETMKLKRLVDKRSQMFDMLRQIIDKYNETAKNMIQSIAR